MTLIYKAEKHPFLATRHHICGPSTGNPEELTVAQGEPYSVVMPWTIEVGRGKCHHWVLRIDFCPWCGIFLKDIDKSSK